ncbi:aminotransferase class III-fold pyridoxal phosphate-dependent enzyme [Acinetobacter rudis]|uniref:aminotransferase class III-fold pyridoxal phosphate-dependent enzyme n=1 Tax=Acinetobacter rudis TaxID=632955 RepID=UPI00281087BF|nr:aminotransferase class III-fold pyridoxal phosphate-dependent enzyme [Acinetobacter rudis]MDQ8952209.1 aminotransferase class III-fold pyridoxal phosphate-dependent enzyme [Acinetobacter rudis]
MYRINEYRQKLLKSFNIEIHPISAQGNILFLENGAFVYDYLSQYGAVSFGHNSDFLKNAAINFIKNNQASLIQPNIPTVVEVFASQLIKMVNNDYYSRCIMSNSGAETVEAALKLARIKTGRSKILSVVKGFHGKTFAALSASGSNRFKKPFIHDEEHYDYVELNDISALQEKLSTQQYAAFIVEPILGEGGMIPASKAFLSASVSLCKEFGTMSIFDEIQTGLGRAGDICIAKQFEIYPDCILFSKALGGGLVPVGTAIYSEKFHTLEFDKKHSSTFANNAFAATIALSVLHYLNDPDIALYKKVQELSHYLDQQLDRLLFRYSHIIRFNGLGLMRSFELFDSNAQYNMMINFCHNNGSLAYTICGYLLRQHKIFVMPLLSKPCAIRFEPPLIIEKIDIDRFIDALEVVCEIIEKGRYDLFFCQLIQLDQALLPALSESYPVSFVGNTPIADIQYNQKNGHLKAGKKFAFLIHSTSLEDSIHTFPYAIKQNFSSDQLLKLTHKFLEIAHVDPSPDVAALFTVYNHQCYVDGMFILSPLSPQDMLKLSTQEKLNLMLEYLDIAKDNGAEFIGLGAYTSVISHGGESILEYAEAKKLIITNGNSLTALATVESIFSLIEDTDVSTHHAVVVGARGSVAKLIVAGVAHRYGHLILVGRPGSELKIEQELLPYLVESCRDTQYEIVHGSFFDKLRRYIETTQIEHCDLHQMTEDFSQLGLCIVSDYQLALAKADMVISATSEGKAFLNTQYIKENAVVFDVARPFDFINNKHIKIYEGGLVQQPNPVLYSDCNMVRMPAGLNLACLSETIALSMNSQEKPLSIGKTIDFKTACEILNIAKKQGFTPINYRTKESHNNHIEDIYINV